MYVKSVHYYVWAFCFVREVGVGSVARIIRMNKM